MLITLTRLLALALLLMVGFAHKAEAQLLYVTNISIGTIGVYTTSGAVVNASLVSGLKNPGNGTYSPIGIAVSGSNIYVANGNYGTIGVYTTSGTVLNASLVSGLSNPNGIAVAGENIYVYSSGSGTIGLYTTSGAVVNANLVSGLGLASIAVSGSNIYVANGLNGTISVYTTSGALVNASLVSGLNGPIGIAVSGSNIYVTNNGSRTIGVYTTSGAVVNANLVSGLRNPIGIAVSSSNIYVANGNNRTISAYTTSGAVVNASLVSGLSFAYSLFLVDAADNTNGGGSGISVAPTPSNIVAISSTDLSNIGVATNPVLAVGTLVLKNGENLSALITVKSAGGVIQGPTTGYATLSGALTGPGGLTFNGSGSTILTGANTYSGGTTVSGGTLVVAGASPTGTGDVFIASAGTLMGAGIISGSSTVSGVIKPGNSPGYLSFANNLTLNAGSTYQQDIAGITQASVSTPVGASGYYSFVSISNQLIIHSGATLTPRLSNLFSTSEAGYSSNIYVPVLGDMFRIITATGGIVGRFTTIKQPAELGNGTQLVAFYNVLNSNSVDLATVPTSYSTTLASNTTNTKSVADVLDQLLELSKTGLSDVTQDKLMYSVASNTADSLPNFTQGLAGEIHAASAATLAQAAQRMQQSVLERLYGYPMPPSRTHPAINPNTVNVTSAAVADSRAWGEITYQRSERESNSAGNGYSSNLQQIVTGVEAYSNAALGLNLGGGISLSNTTVAANGGNSTIQQGSLFVYGKMSVLQDYALDGMASVGLSSTNLSRNDPTGYTGRFSNKAVMGNEALVSVGISRAFKYNVMRVTPYARLSYQYVGQNSYDEGSGVAALNIARFSGNALRGVLGVATDYLNKDPLKDGFTYRANIAVGADSSGLLNPTLNTTLGGFSSSVTTATAGSAFVQVGLYGTVKISDNAYAFAGVSGEARTGQTQYGGSIGLRMAF